MIRLKPRHVALAVVAAALAAPAAATTAGESGLPTAIGKGEGKLVVIEWPAYSDPGCA
jgi:hypothetical protein